MKHWTGIIIGVILISLVAAGCSKIIVTQNTIQTEPTTLYDTIGINSASTKSANGLSFSVSTDQSAYAPGQEVEVVTDEKNTLSKTNNIPVSDDWSLDGLIRMYFGPAGYPNVPYGIAVYRGDYSSANFSRLTQLNLYDPSAKPLATAAFAPTSYSFEPLSDIADIIPGKNIPSADAGSNTPNQQISAEITLKGYWTNSSVPSFTYFDPGIYTVVGGDEWGNLVFVHFTVSDSVTTNSANVSPENAPVKVLSVLNAHLNPPTDYPTVELNLENVSTEPIVSLSAALIEFSPQDYNFGFNVSLDNPLQPGENVIGFSDLFEGEFGTGISYSLKISGTYKNGDAFTFTWEPPGN
jgi:hypothetical protein